MVFLRVGTDCSGLDTPLFALRALDIECDHVFSSDINADCIDMINANHAPCTLYGDPASSTPDGDITKRDPATTPPCDLYVCGFPCQPFSRSGAQRGLDDARGGVFFSCVDYIQAQRPKWFVLENVRTLLTIERGEVFARMMECLARIPEYAVSHQVCDTKQYGIPQSRQRLYIVGVRDGPEFVFPPATECLPLSSFVDRTDTSVTDTSHTKCDRAHLCRQLAHEMARRELPVTFFDQLHMQRRMEDPILKHGYPHAPCITANSYHWCVPMGRRASVRELLWLQGIPEDVRVVVSDTAARRMIGNSMSCNVLLEIFRSLLAEVV